MRSPSRIAIALLLLAGRSFVAEGVVKARAGQNEPAGPILVAAASSLKEVLQAAADAFAAQRPGRAAEFHFASSGQLVRQIEMGAPVDLFVSASSREVDRLVEAGAGAAADRRILAASELIVIVGLKELLPEKPENLLDPRFDRIAIGNPATVPAGRYAEEALRSLGLWEKIHPRLVFGADVRQVVEYVARGEAPAGIVYATDARAFRSRVSPGPLLPASSHSPILYEALIPAGCLHREAARKFLDFLSSEPAEKIFFAHGFAPPPPVPLR